MANFFRRWMTTLKYDWRNIFCFSGSVKWTEAEANVILVPAHKRLFGVDPNAFVTEKRSTLMVAFSSKLFEPYASVKVARKLCFERGSLGSWECVFMCELAFLSSQRYKSTSCRHSGVSSLPGDTFDSCVVDIMSFYRLQYWQGWFCYRELRLQMYATSNRPSRKVWKEWLMPMGRRSWCLSQNRWTSIDPDVFVSYQCMSI